MRTHQAVLSAVRSTVFYHVIRFGNDSVNTALRAGERLGQPSLRFTALELIKVTPPIPLCEE